MGTDPSRPAVPPRRKLYARPRLTTHGTLPVRTEADAVGSLPPAGPRGTTVPPPPAPDRAPTADGRDPRRPPAGT
jgi:hypothetical protein